MAIEVHNTSLDSSDLSIIPVLNITQTPEIIDTTAPAAVSNLAASTGTNRGEINLSWTSPGDDNTTGTASTYIIKYSISAITNDTQFNAATDVSGEPAPASAGSVQSIVLSGFTPGQTYYFAIKSQDEVPNTSGLSNGANAVAKANSVPVLTAIGNKSVNENSALTFTVNASDVDGDALTFSATNLPSGATFNTSTRVFSWTPTYTQAGTYPAVHFSVTDGTATSIEDITITVVNVNRAPVLSSIGSKTVAGNALLTFSISATDADNDTLVYSAAGLPSGATFFGQTFSWTPTAVQAGTYTVTFEVSDDYDATDSEAVVITVTTTADIAPVLASIGNKTVDENVALTFTVSATDADNDPITLSASSLPSGAVFNSSTGVFSWTPSYSQSGTYSGVRFTASDGILSDYEDIVITVTNINRVPVLAAIGNKSVAENAALTFTVSASDADSDTLTYSASGLPTGATLNSSTGAFTWTPSYSQSGSYSVTFSVSDGNSGSDSEAITVTVTNVNQAPVLAAIGNKTVAENAALSFTVMASDADSDPVTLSASNLPSGASFNTSTGVFSWTPSVSQSGMYAGVRFTSSDGTLTDFEDITITVTNANQAPVLAAIGNKTVNENVNLSFTVSGADADGDALTYSATGLPTGATLNSTTGAFSWTPSYSQSGSHAVTFLVSDGTVTDSEAITIAVSNVNRAPILAAIGDKSVSENSALTFTVSVSDLDGDSLTLSASNLPAGSSFNTSTGVFGWSPSYSQAGTYSGVRFTVSDGSATDYEDITITVSNVNRAPVLSLIGDKTVNENVNLSFTVSGADADGDALTYSATGLPTGSTFNTASGAFSWTSSYSQSGSYGVVFTISDGNSGTDSETITITVADMNRAPVLSAIGNKTVNENVNLSFTLSATDADNDTLTYSATGLPTGATLNSTTGAFTWTPSYSQSGSHAVTFSVSDGNGGSDSEAITISVGNVNRPPVLAIVGNKSVAENVNLAFSLSGSDPDNDTLTYSATGLPTGATLNSSTGAFSWTPSYSQSGSHAVTFLVSDGTVTDSEAITITVSNVNQAPVLAAIGNKAVAENAALTFTLSATDADNDTLTYSATGLPTGATLNSTTGAFSWTPS
ncbi:MAG: putative Ig domain-containing protein, partial [Candidatus Omnitrophota bacterium]